MPRGGNPYVARPNPDGALCEAHKVAESNKWYYWRVPRAPTRREHLVREALQPRTPLVRQPHLEQPRLRRAVLLRRGELLLHLGEAELQGG